MMQLEEARKLATPGPLIHAHGNGRCFHAGNLDALVVVSRESGEAVETTVAEVWPTGNPRIAKIDAALLAHAYNMLPELVDALERRIERAKDEYPKHQWEEEGILRDEAVLARADEVPGI